MDFKETEKHVFNSSSFQWVEYKAEIENTTSPFSVNNSSKITQASLPLNQDVFNFQMLSWELSTMSLPCLIVSPLIIFICILVSNYILRVVSNNVIIGTFRFENQMLFRTWI